MLELYHGGPGANSLKTLLPLKEKGLEFTREFLESQRQAQAAARGDPTG